MAIMNTSHPEETLILETQLHWIIFLMPMIFSVALAVFIYHQSYLFVLNYAALALIAYFLSDTIIRYLTTSYTLTSQRLIIKRGFIFKRTWDIPLNQVESIELLQSLFGKIVGYGNVLINKTGGNMNLLETVDQPAVFRQQMFAAMEKNNETH